MLAPILLSAKTIPATPRGMKTAAGSLSCEYQVGHDLSGDVFACQQTSLRFHQRVVKRIGGLFLRGPSRLLLYAACLEEAQESPGAS